jgi:hypothetical protein
MKKYLVNLDVQLCELDGTPVEGDRGNIARTVAIRLGSLTAEQTKQQGVAVVKLYDWSRLLYGRRALELDREDYDRLAELLQILQLPVVIVAQALEIMKKAEKAGEASTN